MKLNHYAPQILLLSRTVGIRHAANDIEAKLNRKVSPRAIRSILEKIRSGKIPVTKEELVKVVRSSPNLDQLVRSRPDLLNLEPA